jgi:hypothetical protein
MNEIIRAWEKEYNIPIGTINIEYHELPATTSGISYFYPKGKTIIHINDCLTYGIGLDECLWHEFAHAWEWYNYGTHGHGERWRTFYETKPFPWYARLCGLVVILINKIKK